VDYHFFRVRSILGFKESVFLLPGNAERLMGNPLSIGSKEFEG